MLDFPQRFSILVMSLASCPWEWIIFSLRAAFVTTEKLSFQIRIEVDNNSYDNEYATNLGRESWSGTSRHIVNSLSAALATSTLCHMSSEYCVDGREFGFQRIYFMS